MRVERGAGRLWVIGAMLGATLAPGAHAEGLFGTAQVQYQRIDDFGYALRADGTLERRPLRREFWLQSYDVNHRAYPRTNVLVQSSLRFSDLSYRRRPDTERVPTGSVRVVHPYANFFASTQPSFTRTAVQPPGGVAVDSTNGFTVTTRRREHQALGRVAIPRWPSLDVSYLRQSRDAIGGSPGDRSSQRNARLAYDRDWWSTYASWTDQRFERSVPLAVPLDQRVIRTGGSVRFTPTPKAGLDLQYGFTDTRSGFKGQRTAGTSAHNADVNGSWRHTTRWMTSLSSNLRRVVSTQVLGGPKNDFESALLTSWQPVPIARLTAGGGARSVRLLSGQRTLVYATTVAAADGPARPGWRVGAQASNTLNWDPERGTYAVQTASTSSRMTFGTRGQLDGDWQVVSNGDTAAASQRYANTWGARLFVRPLRNVSGTGTWRSYRVGPGLLRPSGVSQSRSLDLAWKPIPNTDITASWGSSGLLPNNRPRLVTRSLSLSTTPRPSVQLTGTWSRSSQERTNATSGQFRAREFASGRAQIAFTRRLAASGGLTVANPGSEASAKEYDAVVTWSFGR